MSKTFKCYTDSGHGWLAVKRQELIDLGILEQVTGFSYQRGKTVYLEEDCDAGLFCEAYRAEHGHKPSMISKYSDTSPIRSYESFTNSP